jgi:hypothetical protein
VAALELEEAIIDAINHSSVLLEYVRSVMIALLDPPKAEEMELRVSHWTHGTPLPAQMVRVLSIKLTTPRMPTTRYNNFIEFNVRGFLVKRTGVGS